MRRAILLVLLTAPTQTFAHGSGEVLFPADFGTEWHPDPLTVFLLAVVGIAYWRGWVADRRSARPALSPRHVAAFLAGATILAAALLSPLESWSGTLLSAHMLQHLMLVAVAPPLLVAGRPDIALLRIMSPGLRRSAGRVERRGWLAFALRPVPAALLHALAIWAWHLPLLFEAALVSETVHALEHLVFFSTALLFWIAVSRSARSRASALGGLVAIVVTLIQGGLLGALITLAPRPIYPAYGDASLAWGLSPIFDQQLGGLLMWIPGSVVYLLAGLAIAIALIDRPRDPYAALSPKEIQERIPSPMTKATTTATES